MAPAKNYVQLKFFAKTASGTNVSLIARSPDKIVILSTQVQEEDGGGSRPIFHKVV